MTTDVLVLVLDEIAPHAGSGSGVGRVRVPPEDYLNTCLTAMIKAMIHTAPVWADGSAPT